MDMGKHGHWIPTIRSKVGNGGYFSHLQNGLPLGPNKKQQGGTCRYVVEAERRKYPQRSSSRTLFFYIKS